ncbi:hypothetical protein NL676_037333 [Syzygium grande]|nr:hypothetical protein NL676_037333 [Syzygium grande]
MLVIWRRIVRMASRGSEVWGRGRGSLLVKVWLLAMATVGLVVVGSSYTGPAMNPANAFDGRAPAEREDDEQ